MTAAEFPLGIDAEVWEEVDGVEFNRHDRGWAWSDTGQDGGDITRYFVRREPTPTMPVVPSEPGAVIRATLQSGLETELLRADPDDSLPWISEGAAWYADDHIAAWEPLTTRSEWAESVGVEELREAWKSGDHGAIDDAAEQLLTRWDEVGS